MAAVLSIVAIHFLGYLQGDLESGDPMGGFTIGSWVTIQTTALHGDKATKSETTYVIEKVLDGKPVVRVKYSDSRPAQLHTHINGWTPPPSCKTASQMVEVKIQGNVFQCSKVSYTWKNRDETESRKITYWRSEERVVPYREVESRGPDLALGGDVLKLEYERVFRDEKTIIHLDVTKVKSTFPIGDRVVNGVEETLRITEGKLEGSIKRVLSPEVPGRVVCQEFRGKVAGKEASVTVVVSGFSVK